MPKRVVNLSGGACSFWAANRVADRYGTADLVLLFADTLIEDAELYDLNAWTAEYLATPITRVSREMTPWQLFRKEGLIANNRSPICSIRLKREPLDEWFNANMTRTKKLTCYRCKRRFDGDSTRGNLCEQCRAKGEQK